MFKGVQKIIEYQLSLHWEADKKCFRGLGMGEISKNKFWTVQHRNPKKKTSIKQANAI